MRVQPEPFYERRERRTPYPRCSCCAGTNARVPGGMARKRQALAENRFIFRNKDKRPYSAWALGQLINCFISPVRFPVSETPLRRDHKILLGMLVPPTTASSVIQVLCDFGGILSGGWGWQYYNWRHGGGEGVH